MARNDTTNVTDRRGAGEKVAKNSPQPPLTCSHCGGTLELVGNRLFLMYKRARLPQPQAEAWVCAHCGWVEGDEHFQALLDERINHR